MPFSTLLSNLLTKENMTITELSKKCEEQGTKIDKSYISKLIKGKVKRPSKKTCKILSKVLNTDEKKLILEAYIDNAPEELSKFLTDYQRVVYLYLSRIFISNKDTILELNNNMELLTDKIKEKTIADIIIETNNQDTMTKFEDNIDKFITQYIVDADTKQAIATLSLSEPNAMEVKDNGMIPLIPKGARVSFNIQEEYKDGDIVGVMLGNEFLVRKVLFSEEYVTLIPDNSKDYPKRKVDRKKINITGKVSRVIYEL